MFVLLPLALGGCFIGRGPAGKVGNAAARQTASLTTLVTAGKAYLQAGQANDAFILFRRATRLDPKSFEAQLGLAQACTELGSTSQGFAASEAAAALNPKSAAPLITRGRLYLSIRKAERAEKYLKDAVTLEPQNAQAWRDLGQARLMLGSLKPAAMALERARDLNAKDPEVHARLGSVYAADRRYSEATAEFTRAVALDPQNAAYPRNLAWLLIQQDQALDRARELALQSDQLDRGDGDALLAAAVALLKQGYVDDAITELRKAVEQVKTNGDLYIFLAQACVSRGRPEDIEMAVKAIEYVRARGLVPRRASQEDVDHLIEAIKEGLQHYQSTRRGAGSPGEY
ncbi:MAG: tetratricopeptide repeat protein [Candidatus Zipacnadales bacterium]